MFVNLLCLIQNVLVVLLFILLILAIFPTNFCPRILFVMHIIIYITILIAIYSMMIHTIIVKLVMITTMIIHVTNINILIILKIKYLIVSFTTFYHSNIRSLCYFTYNTFIVYNNQVYLMLVTININIYYNTVSNNKN